MVYEVFLVTAVVMLALLPFAMTLKGRNPVLDKYGPMVILFLVAGTYFVHCWTSSGHTLAMKTWRIKLVKVGYAKVPVTSAALRYLFAWGWFMPALAVCYAFGWKDKAHAGEMAIAVIVGIVVWGMTAFLNKDRQFLHDTLAGTRLITLPKPVKPGKV